MSNEFIAIMGIIFGGGGIITAFIALRKLRDEKAKINAETKEINARAAGEEVDSMGGLRDVLEKYQADTARLYVANSELQKKTAEQSQTITTLQDRLKERDAQLNTLRKLADDSLIVKTVTDQLGVLNGMVSSLESARSEAVELLKESSKQVADLVQTNRDLSLHKPPKS